MFIFAHIGIGRRLVKPWWGTENLTWVTLGTILPDLIDKPVFHLLSLFYGYGGAPLGMMQGTRTFGHSGIFFLLLLLCGFLGCRKATAVAVGIGTHLGLDLIMDLLEKGDPIPLLQTVFFPFMGTRFPLSPIHTLEEHFLLKINFYILAAELVGALFLWMEWRQNSMGARNFFPKKSKRQLGKTKNLGEKSSP